MIPDQTIKITYDTNLQTQISFITQAINSGDSSATINSIKALETLLAPYLDDEYKNNIQALDKDIENEVTKSEPDEWGKVRSRFSDMRAEKIFYELIMLMHRKKLLPHR